jgi:hypothetical protein
VDLKELFREIDEQNKEKKKLAEEEVLEEIQAKAKSVMRRESNKAHEKPLTVRIKEKEK